MLIMNNSEQITSQTPYLQDQLSLTLRWRSFSACGCYHVTFSLAYKSGPYVDYGYCEQIASQMTHLQDQILLTLCWRSFSAWGCYRLAVTFAYTGGQYVRYGQQRANHFPINRLTRPKIIDSPLMLIFRMRLLPCRCLFCLYRVAIHWSWITASKGLRN